ncbi:phosphotransferase [Aureococcus anophagefferens]|uniref:Phosphotransferase n=1 Tax=Aureococcus anophagefferens TaxID=44056 RepID=A0ABR1FHH0_AURAN
MSATTSAVLGLLKIAPAWSFRAAWPPLHLAPAAPRIAPRRAGDRLRACMLDSNDGWAAPTAAGLKPVMDAAEALSLAKRACPQFASAGLKPLDPSSITKVETRSVARLWAGMGSVVELRVKAGEDTAATIVAKKVTLPKRCASIGDRRKKASYEVECNFYDEPPRVLSGLAKLHALFWGAEADAAVAGGLAAQGEYWYLDTRPDEHAAMPTKGWEGRLRLAARAIDDRLKSDSSQTIVHGDAKSANIIFAADGEPLFYDFQYVGKACCAKDLAYCLCCCCCDDADDGGARRALPR